ncbi:MAG: hypothetical protein GY895_04885 [Phycisphaera sp.]|nr:hypothetical protein [Phycisphaera sp.]
MEVIDRLSQVWLCQAPVTTERAHGLALPDGASLFGPGQAVADLAFFRRSPGATDDGRLDTMEIDGLGFSFVGRPVAVERVEDVTVMSIDKHHTMLYAAGRAIEVLDFGDGTFATPAWTGSAPIGDVDLPNDWTVRTVELTDDLVAVIPNPATVVMVDGFGFHGPLPTSQLESACR